MADQQPIQFGFTKIIVSDVDRLFDFYRRTFGLEQFQRVQHGEGEGELDEIIMAMPGQPMPSLVVQRFPNRPLASPGEATLGFVVPDLDAVVAAAVEAGATIQQAPHAQRDHGVKVAFLYDPEGHLLELVELI